MPLSSDDALVDELAMTSYCDSYTQYGTCAPEHWKAASETQREFCRSQIRCVLDRLEPALLVRNWKRP